MDYNIYVMDYDSHTMDYDSHGVDHKANTRYGLKAITCHGPQFTRHGPQFTRRKVFNKGFHQVWAQSDYMHWTTIHTLWNTIHTPWTTIHKLWTTIHRPWTTIHTPWTTIHTPWTTRCARTQSGGHVLEGISTNVCSSSGSQSALMLYVV
jgi:hypothetical protein